MRKSFLRSHRLQAVVIAHALSFGLFQAQPIVAQQQLEEVIVTAQRREQSLQDVGVSVTAATADEMRRRGVFSSTDIQKLAPGVVFAAGSSGGVASTLSVRGITQSAAAVHIEQPNAVYIDDVYIVTPSALSFPLYDLDRAEVLRGPQGTLFGRNSTGGLVHFITARPTESFEGYAEVGAGAFSQLLVEGALSGPLSDRVRMRVAGHAEQADGWWKNHLPGGEDVFNSRFWGLRGQLEVDVAPELTARLSASYDKNPKTREGTYKSQNWYVAGNGLPAPLPATLDAYGTGPGNNLIGYRDPYPDGQEGSFNNTGSLERLREAQTLELRWTPGDITVISLTNLTDFKMEYGYEDFDGSPIEYASGPLTQDLEQWSQEIRVTSLGDFLTWTAGAFYLDIDQTGFTGFDFPLLAGSDFAFESGNDYSQSTRTYAVFGQGEWNLGEKWKLTAGLRYTHDEVEFSSQTYFNELGNGYSGGTGSTVFDPPLVVADFRKATVGDDAKHKENLWSGKVQFDYRVAEDRLLYASISRGVKGPGFNNNIDGSVLNEEVPFGSESVIAYEVGSKSELFDRRLRLNGGVYYYDYSDFQGFAFVNTAGVVANYDGEYYGAELEASALLPGEVTISLAASYIHSKLEDVPTSYYGRTDVRGNLAAEWLGNGSITKTLAIGPGALGLTWSFDYIGDRYSSVDNNAVSNIKSSFVHDAYVTYAYGNGIELAAYVKNISDVDREVFNFDFLSSGYRMVSYAPPRWWGISIRKKF